MIDIWKAIYNQLIQKLAVILPISILYCKKKKLSNTNVVFIWIGTGNIIKCFQLFIILLLYGMYCFNILIHWIL